jgi:hypothetical protein
MPRHSKERPVELPLADTSEMIGLHRVFREALGLFDAYVGDLRG